MKIFCFYISFKNIFRHYDNHFIYNKLSISVQRFTYDVYYINKFLSLRQQYLIFQKQQDQWKDRCDWLRITTATQLRAFVFNLLAARISRIHRDILKQLEWNLTYIPRLEGRHQQLIHTTPRHILSKCWCLLCLTYDRTLPRQRRLWGHLVKVAKRSSYVDAMTEWWYVDMLIRELRRIDNLVGWPIVSPAPGKFDKDQPSRRAWPLIDAAHSRNRLVWRNMRRWRPRHEKSLVTYRLRNVHKGVWDYKRQEISL